MGRADFSDAFMRAPTDMSVLAHNHNGFGFDQSGMKLSGQINIYRFGVKFRNEHPAFRLEGN